MGKCKGRLWTVKIPPWPLYSSATLKHPKPWAPQILSFIQPYIFTQRMAKALLQRVMHWVNKATKHISIYTTHFRETGLEMKQNVRAVKEKKLSNSSTFLLTSYFSTSAGTTSFHGNAQVISIDYIFFLSVCEGRVSPWRLRGQQSVVANLRNKDELHKVGFHKFSTFKKSLVLWNNLSKSQKVKRKKKQFWGPQIQ